MVVEDEDYVAGMVAGGVPDAVAQMLLSMFRAARRGGFAVTDPTLGQLLGRAPQSVRTVLKTVVAGR